MDPVEPVFESDEIDFSVEQVETATTTDKQFRAPVWVTVIAFALGVFGIAFGLWELFNPGGTGILELEVAAPDNKFAAMSWGVRNAALGATMIAAIMFRHAGGYIVAFIGAIARDGGDLFIALGNSDQGIASYLLIGIFLVLEALCLVTLLAKGVKFKLG